MLPPQTSQDASARRIRRVGAFLLIAVLASSLLPSGLTNTPQEVGGFTMPTDGAAVHQLRDTAPDDFCFVDDGDGLLQATEPVYLTDGCGILAANDVRIANPPSTHLVGSQVRTNDSDVGDLLTTIEGNLMFSDDDGDDLFTTADRLYYNDNPSETSQKVGPGDLVLSGADAGTVVADGTAGLNDDLEPLPGTDAAALSFLDLDGDRRWGPDDDIYIDADDDGFATVADVRLGRTFGTFGESLGAQSPETTYELQSGGSFPTTLCFIDENGSGTLQADEPIYASGSCGTVAALDIRVANPSGGYALGSQVLASSSDYGQTQASLVTALWYANLDQDEDYGLPEALFLDAGASGAGEISVGDVRISGDGVRAVAAGEADLGHDLRELGLDISNVARYFDTTGDASYGHGDLLFLDLDEDGYASVGDLQVGTARQITTVGGYAVNGLSAGAPDTLCYDDVDGDQRLDDSEPVYIAQSCGIVRVDDINLLPRLGAHVREWQSDVGRAIRDLDHQLAFDDLDQDAVLTAGDVLYVDLQATSRANAAPGVMSADDIRLAPIRPASASSGDRMGRALVAMDNYVFLFAEENGNGAYDGNDYVYLDRGGAETPYVNVGDVVLSTSSGIDPAPTTTSGAATTTGTATTAPTQTSTNASTMDQAPTLDASPEPGPRKVRVPGPPAGLAIGVLALAVVVARRLRGPIG